MHIMQSASQSVFMQRCRDVHVSHLKALVSLND